VIKYNQRAALCEDCRLLCSQTKRTRVHIMAKSGESLRIQSSQDTGNARRASPRV